MDSRILGEGLTGHRRISIRFVRTDITYFCTKADIETPETQVAIVAYLVGRCYQRHMHRRAAGRLLYIGQRTPFPMTVKRELLFDADLQQVEDRRLTFL